MLSGAFGASGAPARLNTSSTSSAPRAWMWGGRALAASVFHSGEITIPTLRRELRAQGIEVKP